MLDLKINQDRDLVFTDDVQLVVDVDEVRQAVGIELTTREGEFFADTEMGLDQQFLLGKDYDEQYATLAISECLQKDARVTSVDDVQLTKDGRSLNVETRFAIDASIDTAELEVQLDA